ncbi:MAG: copper amine oxidase N-terminal domain-containing protein [Clostridiales bacterium]|nr:copper amine oxidase N-terminal domain-containing protein [Clostridiales bacterium]
MKKLLSLIVAISISSALLITSVGAEYDITVELNGNPIAFDQPPIIQDSRTLVPMRAIFEALGADVHWVENLQVIIAFKGHSVCLMKIGEKELFVTDTSAFDSLEDISNQIYYAAFGMDYDEAFDKEEAAIENFMQFYEFDVVPQIINGRTLIPVRAVSEALGVSVDWDRDNYVVELSCSDEFVDERIKNQSLVDEIIYLYEDRHSEAYKPHQGGYENPESEYILKQSSNLKFNHKTISGTGHSGLAVKEDNSLWAWGPAIMPLGEWPDSEGVRLLEAYGKDLSTPVQLMEDVLTVAVGESHSIAVKTDGSLCCCWRATQPCREN